MDTVYGRTQQCLDSFGTRWSVFHFAIKQYFRIAFSHVSIYLQKKNIILSNPANSFQDKTIPSRGQAAMPFSSRKKHHICTRITSGTKLPSRRQTTDQQNSPEILPVNHKPGDASLHTHTHTQRKLRDEGCLVLHSR